MFGHISKYLKVRSSSRRIFDSLLGAWKCGQTRSFLCHVLLEQMEPRLIIGHERLSILLVGP